jgi:uncharacterized RDD family membrane protein YckC
VAQPTTSPDAPAAGDLPSLARRFCALLVDWMLCLLAAGTFASIRRDGWAPPLVLLVEYAFFIGLFAQTPGMWVARIRCVAVDSGAAVGIFRAALRGALLCLLVPALIMDSHRRGLHDKAAGSIMVSGRSA